MACIKHKICRGHVVDTIINPPVVSESDWTITTLISLFVSRLPTMSQHKGNFYEGLNKLLTTAVGLFLPAGEWEWG